MSDSLLRLSAALADRYELEREVGAGGMATVYLARDVRHNRKVALKVLHPELSAVLGSERFLKEIELTANLQHPHILPLFDSGEADGLLYYVMPYVEGESLRARLERERQLPVAETLRIAGQVADALEYAHGRGLVHRDIKPENILLHEGNALVADFGIALAVQTAGGERMTQTGLSLGTPQYMAPEQAMGERGVDARADVYALAAVVYEMLAGEPPFAAATAPAVLAKVLTERPASLRAHRPQAPEHVELALERALEKLPADRWQSAKELTEALEGRGPVLSRAGAAAAGTELAASARPQWWTLFRQPVVVTALVVALGLGAAAALARTDPPTEPPTVYLTFPEAVFVPGGPTASPVGVSGDGLTYVWRSSEMGWRIRRLGRPESAILPVGSVSTLTLSPEGRWTAFMSGGAIVRMETSGGPALRVAEGRGAFGFSWGRELLVTGGTSGLGVVPLDGVDPWFLTAVDTLVGQVEHRHPVALDDGSTVLFAAWSGSPESSRIGVASLRTREWRVLDLAGVYPLGVIEGHLIYADGSGALLGIAFDARRQRFTGSPMALLNGVAVGPAGAARAALSHTGSLVFLSGSTGAAVERELVTVGLDGAARPLSPLRHAFEHPRYSPDGRRVALTITEGGSPDVWILDLQSGTLDPLTRGEASERPEWTPDGSSLLYRSSRAGFFALWAQPSDGSRPPELLQRPPNSGGQVNHGVVTPDGSILVYRRGGGPSGDLLFRSLRGDTASSVLSAVPNVPEMNPHVSPDGRWVAYSSSESGALQVYVRALAESGPRFSVSVEGGDYPVWAPDGRRLYYRNGAQMVEATLTLEPNVSVSRRVLFELDDIQQTNTLHRSYDVSPDGSHFLMVRNVGGRPSTEQPHVILNWATEVRARLRENR